MTSDSLDYRGRAAAARNELNAIYNEWQKTSAEDSVEYPSTTETKGPLMRMASPLEQYRERAVTARNELNAIYNECVDRIAELEGTIQHLRDGIGPEFHAVRLRLRKLVTMISEGAILPPNSAIEADVQAAEDLAAKLKPYHPDS